MRGPGNSPEAVWRTLTGCGTLVPSNPQPCKGGDMACVRGPLGAFCLTYNMLVLILEAAFWAASCLAGTSAHPRWAGLCAPKQPTSQPVHLVLARPGGKCASSCRSADRNQSSKGVGRADSTVVAESLNSGCTPPSLAADRQVPHAWRPIWRSAASEPGSDVAAKSLDSRCAPPLARLGSPGPMRLTADLAICRESRSNGDFAGPTADSHSRLLPHR